MSHPRFPLVDNTGLISAHYQPVAGVPSDRIYVFPGMHIVGLSSSAEGITSVKFHDGTMNLEGSIESFQGCWASARKTEAEIAMGRNR
jgi:hypothetical protein